MTKPKQFMICEGDCHCGAVRFQVLVDRYLAYDLFALFEAYILFIIPALIHP